MFGRHQDPHSSVYLLADHLDAILATGEDLPRQRFKLNRCNGAAQMSELHLANRELRQFISSIALSELTITAHLRQARAQAKALVSADPRFASLIKLFLGGTAAIVDALAALGQSGTKTFGHDTDPVGFLRSRALIGEECAGLGNLEYLQPDESMAIAGKIELRGLLDLVAAFLDSLDMAYDLYRLDEPQTAPQRAPEPTSISNPVSPAQSEALPETLLATAPETELADDQNTCGSGSGSGSGSLADALAAMKQDKKTVGKLS